MKKQNQYKIKVNLIAKKPKIHIIRKILFYIIF